MDDGPTRHVLACAQQAARPPLEDADSRLLEAFLRDRDGAAFTELLRRHGPMVLGVCRRILAHSHDAEDAFQATFLVLVRKGTSIRNQQTLRGWLHRVACRAALQARRTRHRREAREIAVSDIPEPTVGPDSAGRETLSLLDGELERLPDRFRTAV